MSKPNPSREQIVRSLQDISSMTEQQASEDRLLWLASFPEKNPMPIVELDLAEEVLHYLNPSATESFPDLARLGLKHPLLADIREAARPLFEEGLKAVQRELPMGSFIFSQTLTLVTENQRVRLYNTDITELKRAGAALEQSQALYQSLVKHMPAGVFHKDAAGKFVFVNNCFCQLFNSQAEDYLGKTASEWAEALQRKGTGTLGLTKIGELASAANDHHSLIMHTGRRIELEEERTYADGRKQYLHVVKAPVFDSEGKITGTQGILFDITARKLAEAKVHELNADLEQRVATRTAELQAAMRELEAFSYSVSHDLRAPLRAINGFSAMALEDFGPLLPEKGKHFLKVINRDGLRMGNLIDDLLAFSRLAREPLKPQPVDVAQLVRHTLVEFNADLAGREMDIRIGELPGCEGDRALLKQVWVNLLSNALKYSRERKPAVVEIGSEQIGGEQIYFVRDNGAGFDMEYADKLFGVFQRLHHQDEFEGTGVGLAIVQRIVQRHGGRIWAKAAVNQGAVFYFTLNPGRAAQ